MRQLCWAHLLRNLRGLEERGGRGKSLGIAGQKIVKDVFREWYRFREVTRRALRRKLKPIRRRLERLLRRHMSNPVPAARKIAKDLRKYGAALWTFATVDNSAERAVRKGVRRSVRTARTARDPPNRCSRSARACAQGRSILDFVEQAIRADLGPTHRPSLLPAKT